MTNQPIDHPWLEDTSNEAIEDGGTWLLELVSAVDYMRRGIRPGLNVWDAIKGPPQLDHRSSGRGHRGPGPRRRLELGRSSS